jgi:pilus assembly protein CpaD
MRGLFRKDLTMRSKFLIIAVGSALAGCNTTAHTDVEAAGLAPVNVPVVTSTEYVFDAAAPGGSLAPGEGDRLNGWFQGLDLGYGDTVYVAGANAPAARAQVAGVAGRYGMLVTTGEPVTAGPLPGGAVRVVVVRRRASVPGCPNWSRPSQPEINNLSMSNLACAVNSNLAAMVADPQDLVHGREGTGVVDPRTAVRAVDMYRSKALSGQGGLQAVSSKGGN